VSFKVTVPRGTVEVEVVSATATLSVMLAPRLIEVAVGDTFAVVLSGV
jgi:hypothetical protein